MTDNTHTIQGNSNMKHDSKRRFTPFAFGCSYFQANPWLRQNHYTVEEIATTFYTPKSKAWGYFIEGFTKELELYNAKTL